MSRPYSLKKSRHILQTAYSAYKKKGKKLNPSELSLFENDLQQLDQLILQGNREQADALARKVEQFCAVHFKKSFFDYIVELGFALVLALIVATIVRSMWFEPYEIPTGSMRPTFREQDHLTVSKLAFGINRPLETKHLYFDPNLVQRNSILIFSGENVPLIDQETTYFGIIPYTKRYIKRLIGKPGDSVYFYGGKLYIVDKDDNAVTEMLDSPYLKGLEHIPYLSFEGYTTSTNPQQFVFNQMHRPTGKVSASEREIIGEVYTGNKWIKDQPLAQLRPHDSIQTYSDFYGMRNYGMAQLLTKQQMQQDKSLDSTDVGDGVLYLEIRHTPSLNNPVREGSTNLIIPYKTVLPISQKKLNDIFDNLYTARFVVKNGRAERYSVENIAYNNSSPRFDNVPDGTYEFYNGKGMEVRWGGILKELPEEHPLNARTAENIQRLFNLGIEVNNMVAPKGNQQRYFPQRYAYYRNGDLFLLGAPIFKKGDPVLEAFQVREQKREKAATAAKPYVAFKDYGAPVKAGGAYDVPFIRTFGATVPEKHYLVLGDNHAMSSDSRVFGYVPEDNLQGAPSIIIWPPGDRLGFPMQKPYPIVNVPRVIIWGIALLALAIWYFLHRRNMKKPIFKKINFNKDGIENRI
jgi:signal peptidase I